MLYEQGISVKGEIKTVWQNLLNTLLAYRYQIETQLPYTQISAKRGSKVVSFVLEGAKGGYRELHVTLSPTGKEAQEFAVQFRFSFPNWAMTWPGTKKECSSLIDEFAKMTRGETDARGDLTCEKCQARNPSDASFCRECGAKLAPETSIGRIPAPETLACPQCKAAIPAHQGFAPGVAQSLHSLPPVRYADG